MDIMYHDRLGKLELNQFTALSPIVCRKSLYQL